MTWKSLRALCLGFAGASETFPFDPEYPVFKAANGRIFAVANEQPGALTVTIKCDPPVGEALRSDFDAVTFGYHFDKRHWITITPDRDLPDSRIGELIRDSFDLVSPRPAATARGR